MKKKSLITMLVTLLLVAVVGVGATLAYLTDTDEVTNTFTVGNVQITLDETNVNGGDRTQKGNDYENLQPGDTITKDPTVHLVEGSSECYVFVKVDGLNELLAIKGKNAAGEEVNAFVLNDNAFNDDDWVKVADNIYRYNSKLNDANKHTSSLFETITFNPNVVEYLSDKKPNIDNVVVTAYAIQAKNLTEDQAYTELFTK